MVFNISKTKDSFKDCAYSSNLYPRISRSLKLKDFENGADGTRTRDLWLDRPAGHLCNHLVICIFFNWTKLTANRIANKVF